MFSFFSVTNGKKFQALIAIVLGGILLCLSVSPVLAENDGEVVLKYSAEIEHNFDKKTAEAFEKYAKYFMSIVQDDKRSYICKKLNSVFGNPGEKEVLDRLQQKVEKYVKQGEEIDKHVFTDLEEFLIPIGVALDKKIEIQRKQLEKSGKIIADLEEKIIKARAQRKELESQRKELESQRKELESQRKELESQRKEIRIRILEAQERIKKLDKSINEWEERLKLVRGQKSE